MAVNKKSEPFFKINSLLNLHVMNVYKGEAVAGQAFLTLVKDGEKR
jgi:hypothetical protein